MLNDFLEELEYINKKGNHMKKVSYKSMVIFTVGIMIGMVIMYLGTKCIIEREPEPKTLNEIREDFIKMRSLDTAEDTTIVIDTLKIQEL